MSEQDSGRKRFMGDIMRRIAPSGSRFEDELAASEEPLEQSTERVHSDHVEDAMSFIGTDPGEFRRRLDRMLSDFEALRRRYQRTRDQLHDAEGQNEKLVRVLQESKQQIELLKEEVDKLCAPPNTYGIFTRANKDGTAELLVDGRPMRVNVHPDVDPFQLEEGRMVVLNEAFNVVEQAGYVQRGELCAVSEVLSDNRALVVGNGDDEKESEWKEEVLDKGKDEYALKDISFSVSFSIYKRRYFFRSHG
mgnify:CR=1 FL=1